MYACQICLAPVEKESSRYHARCLRVLFGAPRLPELKIELARMHTAALAMVGHTSLSGIQRKVSLSLSTQRDTLHVAVSGGLFLLKPQTPTYPALPENEHATTRLARLVGLDTAQCGLITLGDGSSAFIARRFDRLPSGKKLRQEDFCQLASKSPKEKYDGTAELCARIVRQHATEPLVETLKLYRLIVFGWWSGNGDMHLKNFSLTADSEGHQRLSPAYDLACTRLVIPEDPLALPVQGLREGLTRETWRAFGEYCRLPARAYNRVLDEHAAATERACRLLEQSPLSAELRQAYQRLLEERSRILAAS